jgi:hypothetical protein
VYDVKEPSFPTIFELPPCVRQENFPLHLAIRLKRHRDPHFSVVATLLEVSDDLRLRVRHPLA